MLAQDLRRLAEEIAAAFEERQKGIADLRRGTDERRDETVRLIQGFSKGRAEMGKEVQLAMTQCVKTCREDVAALKKGTEALLKELAGTHREISEKLRRDLGDFRSCLAQYKVDLDKDEKERQKDAGEEIRIRKDHVADLEKSTQDLVKDFRAGRQEMGKEVREALGGFMKDLAQYKNDLDKAEGDRQADAAEDIKARKDLVEGLARATQDLLKDFQDGRKTMGDDLRGALETFMKDLVQFKDELDKAAVERKQTCREEMAAMAEELRKRLQEFRSKMTATVSGLLGDFTRDRAEAVEAWQRILAGLRSGLRPEGQAVEVGSRAQSVEDALTPEPPLPEEETAAQEEMETVEEKGGEEERDLAREILILLREWPEGLKMVEIAEKLGLANWRSLIPVIKELIDDGELRKDETEYFLA